MEQVLIIQRAICNDLKTHALSEAPYECCGLLGGRDWYITNRYPLRNQASKPERNYFAAPEDLFRVMHRMRRANEELIAIYHSHPRGQAYPSATDLDMAFYPTAIYLIIALIPQVEMRAFRLDRQSVREVTIAVE